MTASAYSCQTGRYTVDQLGGEDCAKCGHRFGYGERPRFFGRIAEWTLFAHAACMKGGASR